jgi:hypothetical protein
MGVAWAKRGSRRIEVAGRTFRCRVAGRVRGTETEFIIVVADYERPAGQLRVPFRCFWEYGLLHRQEEPWKELRIEPRLVAECMTYALRNGWDPTRASHVKITNADLLLPPGEFRVPYPMAEPPEGWAKCFERLEREYREAKEKRLGEAELDLEPDK